MQPKVNSDDATVSVVVPVYNRSGLVTDTLDSVLKQSHCPDELIIVDDGSTDDTLSAIHKWQDSLSDDSHLRVRVVSQQNSGANAARNRGIQEATGDCIAFLDSDDSWLADKLEKQLAVLYSQENIGGVYCGLRNVDIASGEKDPVIPREYPQGDILREMLIHDVTAPTSCWLVKKECFDKAGLFDVSLPARQDWDMWIRVCEHYHIGSVPAVLVEMGNHPGERVRSDGNREIRAHQIIFSKYAKLRARYPFWLTLQARSAMYRRRGRVYFHRNMSTFKALQMQLMAIIVWPFNFDSYAALIGMMLPGRLRRTINHSWNRVFGKTGLAIKTH